MRRLVAARLNRVGNELHQVLLRFEAMTMNAWLPHSQYQALRHAVLLRRMRRDEFLLNP